MYEKQIEEIRREQTPVFSSDTPPPDGGRTSSGYISTMSSISDDRLLGTPQSYYDRYVAVCCVREDIFFNITSLKIIFS